MTYRLPSIPASWRSALEPETRQPYFRALRSFIESDSQQHEILPPASEVYTALELTTLRNVRVLILGQDPYPGRGQAHGLAFSVKRGVKPPASLRNMYRELEDDLGITPPSHGNLTAWSKRGVLLLNAVLTVRAGASNSHRGKGWEEFTDAVIRRVSGKRTPVVFVLWGNYAQKKIPLIDTARHVIVQSAHPSPLSARNGFFGSRPYSRINATLERAGRKPIDWRIPA